MNASTRRKFLAALAGTGAAGMAGLLWRPEPAIAAAGAEHQTTPVPAPSVAEQFTNHQVPGGAFTTVFQPKEDSVMRCLARINRLLKKQVYELAK